MAASIWSSPQSRSGSLIIRGGASRMAVPCVSLARTPCAASRSQAPRPGSEVNSTPAHRPRPRTSADHVPGQGRQPVVQVRAQLRGPFLVLAGGQQRDHLAAYGAGQRVAAERRAVLPGLEDAEHRRATTRPRRPARCRRRAPCRAGTCRARPPRARRRTWCRSGRARTGSRRRSSARRAPCTVPGRRPGSPAAAPPRRPRPGSARSGRRPRRSSMAAASASASP